MENGSGSSAEPRATTTYSPGSGFVLLRPEDLAPRFPHLEILELLGQGGMGMVYKARQPRLDRFVALKVLPPEVGQDPAFADRFAREARALAKLTHPRIVVVYDFGQSDGLFYLLMEFVDGVNLRSLLRQGQLKPEEALRIVPQICEALEYAHEAGVVHRDIKPENILLDRKGNVKIADFGLAKLLGPKAGDSVLTGSRQIMGTPHYMAPEQMEKPLAVDHRADIYSLGVVFYEMLTGELPLGRFAPPSKKVTVDVRLDEVVFRALEKEPERRYQHASEVKTDVESLSGLSEHPAFPSAIRRHATQGRSVGTAGKWRQAWLLITLLCTALLASVLYIHLTVGPGSPIGELVQPMAIALLASVGLWALWQFVRGGRAGDIKTDVESLSGLSEHPAFPSSSRRHGAQGHSVSIAGIWRQACLLITLLCTSYFVGVLFSDLPPEIPPSQAASHFLVASVGLWALWQSIRRHRVQGHSVGIAGIWRQACLLITLLCTSYFVGVLFSDPPPEIPPLQAASHFLVASVGLWALWQFVRGGRAGAIQTVVPELDFPQPRPAWDHGRFPEDDLGPPGSVKASPAAPVDAATLTPGEIFERVWDELRSARGRFTMPAIKALLLTVFAGCLFLFLSPHYSDDPVLDPGCGLKLQAGYPSPWLVIDKDIGSPTYRVEAFSWSWAIIALGVLAGWLHGVIRRVETGGRRTKLDRFVLRGFPLWAWIMVLALGAFSIDAFWRFRTFRPNPPMTRPTFIDPNVSAPWAFKKGSSPTVMAKGLEEGKSAESQKKTAGPEQDSRRAP
jgi:predicted Ser/Thr protein kinase